MFHQVNSNSTENILIRALFLSYSLAQSNIMSLLGKGNLRFGLFLALLAKQYVHLLHIAFLNSLLAQDKYCKARTPYIFQR
jgi:hypothetical protein